MHVTNTSVRKLAKTVVMTFSHHLKTRYSSQDANYIRMSIDADIESYVSLFKVVAGRVFNVTTMETNVFPNEVIDDLEKQINKAIDKGKFRTLMESKIISECAYQVCLIVLKRAKDEVFKECNKEKVYKWEGY